MRILLLASIAASAALSIPAQGEVLYYRFDNAAGNANSRVINFVAGVDAGPTEVSLSNGAASVSPGRFGNGLSATHSPAPANSVDTGWMPAINGSFTIALFVNNRFANSPVDRATLFGETGGFRGDVGATPQGGFVLTGWGGLDLVLEDGTPWCMVNGWTHMALVVDTTASIATLYRGGMVVASAPLPSVLAVAPQSTLRIGDDGTNQTPSLFDIDEVRVLQRAATPIEIASWATAPSAAAVSFGDEHGVTLTTTGGLPSAGNANFGFQIAGQAGAPSVLVLGWTRMHEDLSALLGAPLAGFLHTSLDAPIAVMIGSSGEAIVSVPVPGTLMQGEFFAQAFTLTENLRSSGALACGFGSAN